MRLPWALSLSAISILAGLPLPAGAERVVIEGVDHYRNRDPLFEGVRVILARRGEAYSADYLQGLSGAAFRIAGPTPGAEGPYGPCPCAPTCSAAMTPQDLIRLLGYTVEDLPLDVKGVEPKVRVYEVLARVKDEVGAGRPVLLFHAFTNTEWDVVCGFDEERRRLIGRGSYRGLTDYAEADETRTITCGDICPLGSALLVGAKTGTLDARKAELAALAEAVRHARAHTTKGLREGLEVYAGWIARFRTRPPVRPFAGDFYGLEVYPTTHRAAAGFLREIAPKYARATADLQRTAEWFAKEAEALDNCYAILCPGGKDDDSADAKRNARLAACLTEARDAYAAGVRLIEQALPAARG